MIKFNRKSFALTIISLLSILNLFKRSKKLTFIQESPFYRFKMGGVEFEMYGALLFSVSESFYSIRNNYRVDR